ncbi:MAG: nucleotidyltransferase family protein [Chitinophagales bacterium]
MMNTKPTLLVLAAGMGSRYGGLKQIDGVGPSQETIIDYSVYDAIRAGFGKVVFVIRRDIEEAFKATFGNKFADKITVDYAYQAVNTPIEGIDQLPERTKPWGTGHAVLVAENVVKEPFAVINADDFYGADAFKVMANFLTTEVAADTMSMVGYVLKNTLSDHGTVSRGECQMDADNNLTTVVERTKISRSDDKKVYHKGTGETVEISENTLVSMNFWGFSPDIFPEIRRQFIEFVKANPDSPKAEFYIPLYVNDMINTEMAKVKVLSSTAKWFGVTYKADKPIVENALKKMVDTGMYPSPLWT